MNEQGYQRWLDLRQPAAPAGPAPGTPEVVPAAVPVPIAEVGRVPTTPPDRPVGAAQVGQAPAASVDRPALPKGADPVPSGGWDGDIPCVDIDTDDDRPASAPAPAASAAASSDPGPAVPAADAAAFPGLTRQQLADRLAQAQADLEQRDAALASVQAQLAHAVVGAREQHEELRELNAKNAGWRRRQAEWSAEAEERDSEIREHRPRPPS